MKVIINQQSTLLLQFYLKIQQNQLFLVLSNLTVTLNGKVDYLAGVKGNDNRDPHPQLTIDNKKVRLDKLGDYIVTYLQR